MARDTTPPISAEQRLERHQARWESLKSEGSTWLPHWRELSEQVRPRGSRFLTSETNRGHKVNGKIINGTPGWAARTLAAGMMSGITSPSRPWYRLTTPQPQLAELDAVKAWLRTVEDRIREALQKSNLYDCMHQVYSDLGVPGTAVLIIEEDDEPGTVRGYNLPIGSYYLGISDRGVVDTIYRTLRMTVGQAAQKFGLKALCQERQQQHKDGKLDLPIDVLHAIYPNPAHRPGALGPEGKAWLSDWWEAGKREGFLRESGYHEFPAMAPRWHVTAGDAYGFSPAMDALGDCKALQLLEKRKAQVVDKVVDPPMKAPTSMMNRVTSLAPGDINFVDPANAGASFSPAIEVPPAAVKVVEESIREHEARIKTAFYADLWLMLQQADGQMTAREVIERREEKLLQLGTVLERLQDELLDPLIDRIFAILLRAGQIPKPPQELQGQDLRVEYISIMAQAQKLLGTTALERLTNFVGQLSAVQKDALDKLDTDQVIDEYASALGVPPVVVRTDDAVETIRKGRAQAVQQQQALEQAQAMAGAAKDAAAADTSGDNALTTMLRGLGAPT